MLRTRLLVLLLCLPLAAGADDRFELRGELDLRAVHSEATPSFLYGGLGRLRFDDEHDGLRLGRILLDGRARLSDTVQLRAVGNVWGEPDTNTFDLTELYLQWRPFPRSPLRWQVRLGAFYLPESLENRATGWAPAYSITPSAINSWFGEEFRSIGAEVEGRWLGSQAGSPFDLTVTAGAFGWNDPAGVLLAERGWAFHERQSPLWGHLESPAQNYRPGYREIDEFRELDERPGYYAGAALRYRGVLELRYLHYDNRADLAAIEDGKESWLTRYDGWGLRCEPADRLTLAAQWLTGYTAALEDDAGQPMFEWDFDAWYVLASWAQGPWRATVRYDDFYLDETRTPYRAIMEDYGSAWLLAVQRDFGSHWNLAAEWLEVRSDFAARAVAGLDPEQTETQVQLALRYRFGAGH